VHAPPRVALSDRRGDPAVGRIVGADVLDHQRLYRNLTGTGYELNRSPSDRQRTETDMTETKIFARLKADHDRHRKLLDQINETQGDSPEREKLFEAFRVEVTAHAASEEMSLYATMLGMPDLREEAQHSVSEHKEIDDLLTELYEMDFASTGWLTRFRTMKHRYLHHIDEEEEEMFPAAEKELSDARKKELIKIFEKEKPKEKAKAAAEEPSSEEAKE
jgi:hemerythrin superfamily protein